MDIKRDEASMLNRHMSGMGQNVSPKQSERFMEESTEILQTLKLIAYR